MGKHTAIPIVTGRIAVNWRPKDPSVFPMASSLSPTYGTSLAQDSLTGKSDTQFTASAVTIICTGLSILEPSQSAFDQALQFVCSLGNSLFDSRRLMAHRYWLEAGESGFEYAPYIVTL